VIIFYLLRAVPGNIADILFDAAGMVNPAEHGAIADRLPFPHPLSLCRRTVQAGGAGATRGEARPARGLVRPKT